MSYAQDNGYTPATFDDMMGAIRLAVNSTFSLTYTAENFVGTNYYKYFYALVQKALENETKTAEIFAKLQEYIATTNERIQRPSVSLPGLLDSFESQGYIVSVKRPTDIDAGKIFICVDVNGAAPDYATTKLAICTLIKSYVVGGIVSQGSESETIVLSNGQSFAFKFALPDEVPIVLRLTLTSSENQVAVIPTDVQVRQAVFDNILARYRVGWDFEPQRYYTQVDAPWAATILLEYSIDAGANWLSVVNVADFDEKYTFELGDIEVLIDP